MGPLSSLEESPSPILEAKVSPPRVRAGLVPRQRLSSLLDDAEHTALTLVSAPTGYGKTTAVRAWFASTKVAHAWVTLDTGDNDLVRLWTHVATAADRLHPGIGKRALTFLALSHGDPRPALDELNNGLARFGQPLVVVLDELQAIEDPQALASLEYMARGLPSNARLVLVTRVDPVLALDPLRARGQLTELRARHLAFTQAEATELLVAREGIDLQPGEVAALVERTEGWPAGLYLAALWLRDLAEPGTHIREFAGNHRHVAAYLSGEVLDRVDPEQRSFLLQTAALGRFTVAMCDAVLHRTDSAAMIAELERSNMFLIPTDGRGDWFRYHSLFEQLLLIELAATDPHAATTLHQRASQWCEDRALIAEAAEHATAAGDHRRVADLLMTHHQTMLDHGLMLTVIRLIDALPAELLPEFPLLPCVAAVSAGVARQSTDERLRFLAQAQVLRAQHPERWRPYDEAWLGLVRAALIDDSVHDAVSWGGKCAAVADADPEVDVMVAPAYSVLSVARFFAGDIHGAAAAARRAMENRRALQKIPALLIAQSMFALAQSELGNQRAAQEAAAAAQRTARDSGLSQSWPGALMATALAAIAEREGRLADAERDGRLAAELHRGSSTAGEIWALVLVARVSCQRGKVREAEAASDEALRLARQMSDPGPLLPRAENMAFELATTRARMAAGALVEEPTEAELAVLPLLASDLTLRQIGSELYLSLNTVKSHTHALYRKLGVGSRADAVARAQVLGLLKEGESPG